MSLCGSAAERLQLSLPCIQIWGLRALVYAAKSKMLLRTTGTPVILSLRVLLRCIRAI